MATITYGSPQGWYWFAFFLVWFLATVYMLYRTDSLCWSGVSTWLVMFGQMLITQPLLFSETLSLVTICWGLSFIFTGGFAIVMAWITSSDGNISE